MTQKHQDSPIIVKSIRKRKILFKEEGQLNLYNDIETRKNKGATMQECILSHRSHPLADAIIKVVYYQEYTHWDIVFQYSSKELYHRAVRKQFERELLSAGLLLERENLFKKTGYYVLKVLVPFEKLLDEAEYSRLCLKVAHCDRFNALKKSILLSKAHTFLEHFVDYWGQKDRAAEMEWITARFTRSCMVSFIGRLPYNYVTAVLGGLFTNAQRNLLAFYIICRIRIRDHDNNVLSVDLMVHQGIYQSFYALHDDNTTCHTNMRLELVKSWNGCFKPQPIHKVKAYFGERVAFHYSWIGHYTVWLLGAGIVGLAVFLYGVVLTIENQSQSPSSDSLVIFTSLFDNELTLPFSFFISCWAVLYVQFWHQRSQYLAIQWSVSDYISEERSRPEWYATSIRRNAVNGEMEAYFPWQRSILLKTFSFFVICSVLLLVIGNAILYVFYSSFLTNYLSTMRGLMVLDTILTSLISLISVLLINEVCHYVAKRLTDFENYRTMTEYYNAFITKTLIMSFFNYYGIIIYIGVVKTWTVEKNRGIFGRLNIPNDFCIYNNCFMELTFQMMIFFIGKSLLYHFLNLMEPIWNKFKEAYSQGRMEKVYQFLKSGGLWKKETYEIKIDEGIPQYLSDMKLTESSIRNIETDGYTSSTVQFGFVVLFSASFPLAPILAAFHNVIQRKIDSSNLLIHYKRPFALRAGGIGVWEDWLKYLSYIGVAINALIMTFDSGYFFRRFLKPFDEKIGTFLVKLAFMIAFEHAVILVQFLFNFFLPRIPSKSLIARKRKEYIEKVVRGEDTKSEQDLEMQTILVQKK